MHTKHTQKAPTRASRFIRPTVTVWDALCPHDWCILSPQWSQRKPSHKQELNYHRNPCHRNHKRSSLNERFPNSLRIQCLLGEDSARAVRQIPHPITSQQCGPMKSYCRDSLSRPGPGWKLTTFCLHDSPSMDVSKDVQVTADIVSLACVCVFLLFLHTWLLQSHS